MVQATNVVIQPFKVSNASFCTYNITSPQTNNHLGSLTVNKTDAGTHYDGNSGERFGTKIEQSTTDTSINTHQYLQEVASKFLIQFPRMDKSNTTDEGTPRAALEKEATTTGFTVTIAQEYR